MSGQMRQTVWFRVYTYDDMADIGFYVADIHMSKQDACNAMPENTDFQCVGFDIMHSTDQPNGFRLRVDRWYVFPMMTGERGI